MRYKYSWNEFDCVERVIDTQTKESFEGCENAVKLLNNQDKAFATLLQEMSNIKEEYNKLRTLTCYKDDVKRVEVVNGVEFTIEQIAIIEILKYNYEFVIKDLRKRIAEIPAEIVDKIRRFDFNTNKQQTSYTDYVIKLLEFLDNLLKE